MREKETTSVLFSERTGSLKEEVCSRLFCYFSTSLCYQVNEIPSGEAIKMKIGGWLDSDSTENPPYLEPFPKAKLLMKANYCTFPEGNTESFMKWSKISKLAYTSFFFFFFCLLLYYLCQKQAQKSQPAPVGYLSELGRHPDRPRLTFDPWEGHTQESNNECINKWNNKLVPLSLSPSLNNQ